MEITNKLLPRQIAIKIPLQLKLVHFNRATVLAERAKCAEIQIHW